MEVVTRTHSNCGYLQKTYMGVQMHESGEGTRWVSRSAGKDKGGKYDPKTSYTCMMWS